MEIPGFLVFARNDTFVEKRIHGKRRLQLANYFEIVEIIRLRDL